jgi:hypothetical protein
MFRSLNTFESTKTSDPDFLYTRIRGLFPSLVDREQMQTLYEKPIHSFLISFLKGNPNYFKLSEYLSSEHPVIAIDYAANHFIIDLLTQFASFSGGSFLNAIQLIHFRWEVDLVNLLYRWFLSAQKNQLKPILIPYDFFPYNEFLVDSSKKNMKDFIQLLRNSSSPLLEVILRLESLSKFDNLSQIDNSFKHFYLDYVLNKIGRVGLYSGYNRVMKEFISLEIEKFNVTSVITLLDSLLQDKDASFFNIESIIYSHKNIDGKKVRYYFEERNQAALIRLCKDSTFKRAFENIKDLSDYENSREVVLNHIERTFFSQLISQSKFSDKNIKETVMKLAIAYYFSVVLESKNIRVLNHGIDVNMTKNAIKSLIIEV